MKKSILSLLLVLTMVVSTFAALPMTASAETTYPGGELIFEDFETSGDYVSSAYEIGKARTAKATPGKASTYTSEEFAGLIVYQGSNTVTGTPYDYTTEGPDASLIIEYDIYFEDLVETGSTFLFRLRDADEYNKTNPLDMTFSATSITTAKATFDYQLQDDHWYHMRHIIKGTDSNTNPVRKHDLYIDGVAVITNGAFGSSSYYKFPRLDTLYLSLSAASTATETTAYMDNVCVYKANSSNAMPVDKGGLLAEIREAESILNSGNYSEATKTAAQAQIDIAKEVCTSSEATAEEVASAKTALAAYFENLEEDGEEGGDEEIIYPGGLYFYEPWNTTPAEQPVADSAIASHDIEDYIGDTENHYQKIVTKETLTGGNNTILTITDKKYSTVQINLPESLNGRSTSDAFTTEGPNADLIVEFDLNVDPGNLAATERPFSILVGDKDFVYNTSYEMGEGSSNARRASAAYLSTKVTEDGNLTCYTNAKDTGTGTDMGSVSANEWHRYKMVFHLTDSTNALTTWSLYVDGTAIQEKVGICKAPSIDCIKLVAMGTTDGGYSCNIDNLSVYKKNSENQMFSTESLAIAINRVFANKSNYETAGEGSQQLDDLNTAYDAAVNALSTSYTAAQENEVEAQDAVNEVLKSLEDAEAALKAVLPYYVISEHNIDENDYITAVTVEEIKAYTGSPVKLIVATYDTDGLSDVSMMNFAGADVYELTKTLSVTNKEVAVFVWEMNDLEPLANTYYFGEAVEQD